MNITVNIKHIRQMISPVCLLVVSKAQPIVKIEEAIRAGQQAFAENYIQEAIEKIQYFKKYPGIEWHFIGKIQTNKIKLLAENFDWVQTLASKAQAQKLNAACEKLSKIMQVCIQVNISEESQKNGVMIGAPLDALARYIVTDCPFLHLRGLMSIGLADADEEKLKAMFMMMKASYVALQACYPQIDTLSMGMSEDYVQAICYGSSMVRLGRKIFAK